MHTPIVFVVTRESEHRTEPWKVYDNLEAARKWVDAANRDGQDVCYMIWHLALLTSPPKSSRPLGKERTE